MGGSQKRVMQRLKNIFRGGGGVGGDREKKKSRQMSDGDKFRRFNKGGEREHLELCGNRQGGPEEPKRLDSTIV